MKRKYIKIGEVFRYLTVISREGSYAICVCTCGNEKRIKSGHLNSGSVKSCGCKRSEMSSLSKTIHGEKRSPEKKIYEAMIARCYNSSSCKYPNYGGRGIKVCQRWQSTSSGVGLLNFIEDMGRRPSNLTLERKDVNGDYTPSNCIWESHDVQARNKTNTVLINFKGIKMLQSDWMREFNISDGYLQSRSKVRGVTRNTILKERLTELFNCSPAMLSKLTTEYLHNLGYRESLC